MKLGLHIVLAALLALQPAAALWADSGEPCDMAAMHETAETPGEHCPGCETDCESQACMTLCALAGAAIPSVELAVAACVPTSPWRLVAPSPLIPPGYQFPALRPPICT